MTSFNPYHKWLGIPISEQPPNHYRLLGISLFESDPEAIQIAADRQMTYVAKCANGPHVKISQQVLNELSNARVCLLSPVRRQAYDQLLKSRLGEPQQIVEEADESEYVFRTLETDVEVPYSGRLKQQQKKKSSSTIIFIGMLTFLASGLVYLQISKTPVAKPVSIARPEADAERTETESVGTSHIETDSTLAATQSDQPLTSVVGEVNNVASEELDSMTSVPVDSQKSQMQENPTGASVIVAANSLSGSSTLPAIDGARTTPGTAKDAGMPLKPKPGNQKKANQKGSNASESELPNLPFGAAALSSNQADPDLTSEGKARLAELTKRANDANNACAAIERDCRPLFEEKKDLATKIIQKEPIVAQMFAVVKELDGRLAVLKGRPRFNNVGIPLNAQEDKLREDRNKYNGIYENNKADIQRHSARIAALNEALQYSFIQFKTRWEELNGCRKQWLEICRPCDKYARADFEEAKRVINEWILVDDLWVDAYCWAALCAYDLNEFSRAAEFVEKAEKLRIEVLRSARPFPHIEAMQGLIALQQPGQRSKSPGIVQKAITHVDKDADWQTHFVAGRAAAKLGRQDSKAKAYFERALKIDPECQHAKYWLGHLQTTSTEKNVRDIEAGIAFLESAWSFSGKQSWRIGVALAKAYDAANRKADASQQWETTLSLVPTFERSKVIAERVK